MKSSLSAAARRKLAMVLIGSLMWGGTTVVSAQVGPVAAMIAQARAAGSARAPNEVAILGIELRLRALAPPNAPPSAREAIVSEALGILIARAETDDVLAGLMHGLAVLRESTNPSIAATLCSYASNPSLSSGLRAEAREALRIRCLEGQGDPSACTCPASI